MMRTQTKVQNREYVVFLESYGRKRTVVWKGKESLPLDHPVTWFLERAPGGIQARQVASPRGRLAQHHLVPISENGHATALIPHDAYHESQARIRVAVKRISRPKPAFSAPAPDERTRTVLGPVENYLFCGLGPHLFSYSRVGKKFKIHLEKKLLFEHVFEESRHIVTTHQPGIVLETPSAPPRELGMGLLHSFPAEEFRGSTLRWGRHWWRVNAIPVGDDLGLGQIPRHEEDGARLSRLGRSVGAVCFLLLVLGFVFLKPSTPRTPRAEGVRVTLKQPKPLPQPLTPEAERSAAVTSPPSAKAPLDAAPPPPRLPPEFFQKRPLQPMTGRGPDERAPARRPDPPPARDPDPEPIVRDVDPEEELPRAAPPPPPKANPPARRPAKPINQALARSGLQIRGAGGKANKDAIGQTLERYLPYFQTCYRRALEKDPDLQGVVVAGWTIEPSGETSEVTIVQADLDNAGLIGCITQELAQIRFPPPRGGSVQVEYPIVFAKGF